MTVIRSGTAKFLLFRVLSWLGFASAGLAENENILGVRDELTLNKPSHLTTNPEREAVLVKLVKRLVGRQAGLAQQPFHPAVLALADFLFQDIA